jgi:hypothetical protein
MTSIRLKRADLGLIFTNFLALTPGLTSLGILGSRFNISPAFNCRIAL